MRRMSAVAAAMLVSLSLCGAPAVAQDTSPAPSASDVYAAVRDEAVIVTATQTCDPDSFEDLPGVGWGLECANAASDPRVTGPATIVATYDISTPNDTGQGILVARVTLTGPDGSWIGRMYETVIDTTNGPSRVLQILAGTGGYEGWVYVTSADVPFGVGATPFDWESTGVVYQGPLPPTWETR